MARLSMHEVAVKRKCPTCFFADQEALQHNKKAHDEERYQHEDTKGWCTCSVRLYIKDDGSCPKWKEIKK